MTIVIILNNRHFFFDGIWHSSNYCPIMNHHKGSNLPFPKRRRLRFLWSFVIATAALLILGLSRTWSFQRQFKFLSTDEADTSTPTQPLGTNANSPHQLNPLDPLASVNGPPTSSFYSRFFKFNSTCLLS